jgi:hypothetical protein
MSVAEVLEGRWEEVLRAGDRLQGRHVRLIVLEEAPAAADTLGSDERVRAWLDWCASPRAPAAPLSDAAVSRERIYSPDEY